MSDVDSNPSHWLDDALARAEMDAVAELDLEDQRAERDYERE